MLRVRSRECRPRGSSRIYLYTRAYASTHSRELKIRHRPFNYEEYRFQYGKQKDISKTNQRSGNRFDIRYTSVTFFIPGNMYIHLSKIFFYTHVRFQSTNYTYSNFYK